MIMARFNFLLPFSFDNLWFYGMDRTRNQWWGEDGDGRLAGA